MRFEDAAQAGSQATDRKPAPQLSLVDFLVIALADLNHSVAKCEVPGGFVLLGNQDLHGLKGSLADGTVRVLPLLFQHLVGE